MFGEREIRRIQVGNRTVIVEARKRAEPVKRLTYTHKAEYATRDSDGEVVAVSHCGGDFTPGLGHLSDKPTCPVCAKAVSEIEAQLAAFWEGR